MTLGTRMGATYFPTEPDITTVGQQQWRSWFTSLLLDDKLKWASAYKGEPVTTTAAALSLARQYAEKAGFEPQDVFLPYAYSQMAIAKSIQDRRAMLLAGGALVLVGYLVLRRRRRRR